MLLGQLRHSVDQPLGGGVGVRKREQRHDPAMISQFGEDPVLLVQPVRGLEAGQSEPGHVDVEVHGV
jgi:hypothetical protein